MCNITFCGMVILAWSEMNDRLYHLGIQVFHWLKFSWYMIRNIHWMYIKSELNLTRLIYIVHWRALISLQILRFQYYKHLSFCITIHLFTCTVYTWEVNFCVTFSSAIVGLTWVLLQPTKWSQVTKVWIRKLQ